MNTALYPSIPMNACVLPCPSLLVPFQWPMEREHSFLQCYSLVKPIPPPVSPFLSPFCVLQQWSERRWKTVSHWPFWTKRTMSDGCKLKAFFEATFDWVCLRTSSLHQFGRSVAVLIVKWKVIFSPFFLPLSLINPFTGNGLQHGC